MAPAHGEVMPRRRLRPNRESDLKAGTEIGGLVVLSIRDTGPGIDDPDLARIFEGFFTTKEEGIGIGLATCQSIIAAHGGSITAANHSESGAEFRVVLPAFER
jgi:signal transduction histidine kinase